MAFKKKHVRYFWLWALSPTVIGLVLVLLLAEFRLIEFHLSIHYLDTLILFSGLLVTTLISSLLLSQEGIRRIQTNSQIQLRITFAEDRARFLHRLDHEIKNPLMGIQTALDNLSHEQDPEKRQHIRNAIGEQIDRLTRLVAELRRIAEMEQHEIEQLPVNVNMLLDEAFSIMLDDEMAHERQTQLDVTEHLPFIVGDYDLLLLAIHNVLANAVKYTDKGDKIRLAARLVDTSLQIAISDTGKGIQSKDLPFVMDELYRSEEVKGINGSGIGLALVKRIVDRHDGKIIIDSVPGKGTTVVMDFQVNHKKGEPVR